MVSCPDILLTLFCWQMFAKLEEVHNLGRKFKKHVKETVGVKHIAGTHDASSEGTTHSVKDNELIGFADWINK